MRYLRAIIIFISGSVLSVAAAVVLALVLDAATSLHGLSFAIAGVLLLAGIGLSLVVAIRSQWRSERYDHCPACAADVRHAAPEADGSLRCPSCAQWLTPAKSTPGR